MSIKYKLFLFFSFLVLSSLYLVLHPKGTVAQIPSLFAECNETRPREYHSLRPYQKNASCFTLDTNLATFCGNELTIGDTIEVEYPGNAISCTTRGERVYCDYSKEVDKTIEINLEGADLPIVGNTGDEKEVINYENKKDSEGYTDAYKMSEYVSWYLNGVTNSKEYYDKTDDYSSVNSSGVVAKLLPRQIQESVRVKEIEKVGSERHDQVVVCSLLGKPVDCHYDNIVKAIFDKEWRLTDWNGKFVFNQLVGGAMELFAKLIPQSLNLGQMEIRQLWLEQIPWDSKKPPLPWQNDPITGKPFETLAYRKAYNEWQGKYCLILPVLNSLVCLNNLFTPDKVANLFPYIPLSSTEDVEGQISVDALSLATNTQQSDVILTDVQFNDSAPAKLYFSHLKESDQLGSLLQDTFVPKDAADTKAGSPTNIDTSKATCKTVEVRSNAGDDLFATNIKGKLHYVASFTCEYKKVPAVGELESCPGNSGVCVPANWSCGALPNGGCKQGYKCGTVGMCIPPAQTCTKNVYLNMSTQSKIPVINDVWSRLVAGPMSIVKRIFPQTNSSELGTLLDTPGSTNISYTGTDIDVSQSTTNLKIPHVGGISEYFLNGIQTALRPKGYGKPISFGGLTPDPKECSVTEIPPGTCDGSVFSKYSPPSQTTASGKNYFSAYILPILSPDLLAIYKEAERQTGVPCEVLAGIHFREGGNNPNQSLQDGGPLDMCLIDSAIEAAEHLKGKVGGTIDSWNELITGLARYNGMGNSNCSDPSSIYSGPCPPPSGMDHNYVINWMDYDHLRMNIIYCWDHKKCLLPYPIDQRPGALTVATDLYNH